MTSQTSAPVAPRAVASTPPGAAARPRPSQNERVRAALRRGPVNSTAFMLPDVYDGGRPINRMAPRIYDLRHRYGCEIRERREKNGTSTYTLVSELDAQRHDNRPTWEAHGDERSLTGGVVSLGAPSPQGSDGCPSLLRPSEPTLFEWTAVAA